MRTKNCEYSCICLVVFGYVPIDHNMLTLKSLLAGLFQMTFGCILQFEPGVDWVGGKKLPTTLFERKYNVTSCPQMDIIRPSLRSHRSGYGNSSRLIRPNWCAPQVPMFQSWFYRIRNSPSK